MDVAGNAALLMTHLDCGSPRQVCKEVVLELPSDLEALFLICRLSLLANENRDCFLWAVSLQEMRPEAGEACFFGSHAKAYPEKHGVYSLTRLHSKF